MNGVQTMSAVTIPSGEDVVPVAILSWSLRAKPKKKERLFRLSYKGRPNPILASGKDEGG